MIPLRDQNPAVTTPYLMRALVVINVAVFLFEVALGPSVRGLMFTFGFMPAALSEAPLGDPTTFPPAATLVTSMFLHGGWAHLIGNLWYLWIFGDNVEDRLRHLPFLFFYLASGLAAALIHWASHPGSTIPTVGASGAIAGVLGAYLRLFPRARVVTLLPLFPVFPVVALPAVVVLGLWFLLQFLSGTLSLGVGRAGGVAWWAHVGGFVFGVLLAPVLDRGAHPSER